MKRLTEPILFILVIIWIIAYLIQSNNVKRLQLAAQEDARTIQALNVFKNNYKEQLDNCLKFISKQ